MSFSQHQQQAQVGSSQLDYGQLMQANNVPVRPSMAASVSSGSTVETINGAKSQQRSVVRAACLACRTAKRRCDGVAPVCGPCQNRGVESGQCNFVSSKRGGPRYKGVKGAEATKVKADKDKAKEVAKGSRARQPDQSTNYMASDAGSTPSQQSASPPANGVDSRATSFSNGWRQGSSTSSAHSYGGMTNPSASSYSSFPLSTNGMQMPTQATSSFQQPYPMSSQQIPQSYPQNHNPPMHNLSTQFPPPQQPFALSNEPSPTTNDPFGSANGGPLSFANLEMWQKIQEGAMNEDLNAFSDFYSRLEMLPKAGAPQQDSGIMMDPLDVLMDWEGGEIGNNLQDNEQGARNLLTDFYDMVYPSCPVLLPPGNLPSLAFYFSGKGPCGLFAAISSVVSLHLPQQEAVKTLKNSQAAMARIEGKKISNTHTDKSMPTDEVAAYHARTSEMILHQYAEAKSSCNSNEMCPNPFAGMDEELITIEAAAAHTLLCHYYYGSGKPLSHQRAYKHAVEAWDLAQNLDLRTKSHHQDVVPIEPHHPNPTRPFSAELKLEWGKRVYWASYSAATVMSCTGGFQPFGNSKDEVMDLKLRPHLEHDVAAWGIMVRGAQQVSRTYRLLYDLDQFRARLASSGSNLTQDQLHQVAMERQTIFNAMLKLDSEIGTYTRFDPSWRNATAGVEAPPGRVSYVESVEKQLAKSLKLAGRLMTSGALIILHRAQAFSNARVFMQPQCGMPEAIRLHKPVKHDVILHRADADEVGIQGFPAQHGQVSNNLSPAHPFLTDRFAGGPFEPTHSLERCRFAASAMISILPSLLYNQELPKLPPYSACSFVLGAYATLMLTLLIQVHAEEGSQHDNKGDAYQASSKVQELRRQLAMHRAPVKDIIIVLNRFSTIWPKAIEYQEEVSTLLAANETIG